MLKAFDQGGVDAHTLLVEQAGKDPTADLCKAIIARIFAGKTQTSADRFDPDVIARLQALHNRRG